ncbi:MAG: 2-oxoglutarate and iron-dependent oxygenase domain-containing protein [Flavobacteriales bacterium]|nr:2-oxoglutarate and iron-dependent oxygenase domain-containing protein [Flavobacteriales bacterium]
MSDFKQIPSINLEDFRSGNPNKKEAFVKQLGDAYERIGFVAVKNHGLSDKLCNDLYTQVQNFFNLPNAKKRKYEIEGLAGQRGYVSFGKEHAKNRNEGDLKEFWHFGQNVTDGDPIRKVYPDNINVLELPHFNKIGLEAYKKLEDTGKQLLRAIALHLGLTEDYFEAKIHNGNSILRPIHYPPITKEPKNAVRAAEHEDINLITLLIGASAEGLQVQNKSGEWISVTALPEQIIVNVGDMLQRLTNNKLKSTTHRVVNPAKEKWNQSRYSIPFFLHPRADMSLACLECCIDSNKPKQYSDITAGAYLNQRIKELGLT